MKDSKNIRKELNLTNEEIKEMLMKNFKLDKQGRPVISKDDEWYYEDEWDKTSILESIERSFREIKQFKKGETQFKTLKESQALWDKWAEEVDDESSEKLTTADLMLSPKLKEIYYKYWDNKLAEDMQNPKTKKVFEEENKIYKEMRELEEDEYKKWEKNYE